MVRFMLVVFLGLVACDKHERRAFTTWDKAAAFIKEQICADTPGLVEPEPHHAAGGECSLRPIYAARGTRCSLTILAGAQRSDVRVVTVLCLGLKTPVSARLLTDLALGTGIDIAPAELLALTADPDPDAELTLVWQRSDVQLRFIRTWNPDLNVGDAALGLTFMNERETIHRHEIGPHRFGTISSKYLDLQNEILPATPTW
jgi:hypothetical protein